jgi:DNA adenine methylase
MSKHHNLISYFGGKHPHLSWLLPLFPKGHYHFVDIMCGSANVALNVDYPLVTINDINDEVINLFQVLREEYDEFMRLIYFTPFSRSELIKIVEEETDGLSNVERARRYFTRSQLGYGANGSQNKHKGCGFEYAIQNKSFYRVFNWNAKLGRLPEIVDKLRHMQIENRDSLLLFDKVNQSGTIVYFDPPYVLSTRKSKKRYAHEVEDDFHERLRDKVKGAKCMVAISGYESPLYDELFDGMNKHVAPPSRQNNGNNLRKECLWTNYSIQNQNLKLWDV